MTNIPSIFNDNEENYFKIKIDYSSSEKYIKNLILFLDKLEIKSHLDAEPEILSNKYSDWIGRHEFFRTEDYVIHIIFGNDSLYLIVKCSLEKRKNLIEILQKSMN
ncbi:hypothetical protein KY346_00155 [Candidatus Woesearchaeota archaeon]|nr:hypothetical protein [Candidatus Woesearchaeota archaeon]